MTVNDIINSNIGKVIHAANNLDRIIEKPFCCDLLSLAMSKASSTCAWVTVMGNVNTLAVASLTEVPLVILSEGVTFDELALSKAREADISIICTDLSIFDAALKIYNLVHG